MINVTGIRTIDTSLELEYSRVLDLLISLDETIVDNKSKCKYIISIYSKLIY